MLTKILHWSLVGSLGLYFLLVTIYVATHQPGWFAAGTQFLYLFFLLAFVAIGRKILRWLAR